MSSWRPAYKLKDPELVRECLEKLSEIEEGTEEGDIPNDLFDFILGHDQIKDLLWRSINAEFKLHESTIGKILDDLQKGIDSQIQVPDPPQIGDVWLFSGCDPVARLKKRMREMERMTTWIFGGANRDTNMWPELKSRFFAIHLKEYSEADFLQISRAVREKVDPGLATLIATALARQTRDVREAIHFGRLCKTEEDIKSLLQLKYPGRGLF